MISWNNQQSLPVNTAPARPESFQQGLFNPCCRFVVLGWCAAIRDVTCHHDEIRDLFGFGVEQCIGNYLLALKGFFRSDRVAKLKV